jgi:hypothetical protein
MTRELEDVLETNRHESDGRNVLNTSSKLENDISECSKALGGEVPHY